MSNQLDKQNADAWHALHAHELEDSGSKHSSSDISPTTLDPRNLTLDAVAAFTRQHAASLTPALAKARAEADAELAEFEEWWQREGRILYHVSAEVGDPWTALDAAHRVARFAWLEGSLRTLQTQRARREGGAV